MFVLFCLEFVCVFFVICDWILSDIVDVVYVVVVKLMEVVLVDGSFIVVIFVFDMDDNFIILVGFNDGFWIGVV